MRDAARRLERAVADEDWQAAIDADRALAALLAALAGTTPSADERRAVAAAGATHARARAACEQALVRGAAQLESMCANREGWLAYAISEEAREGAQ